MWPGPKIPINQAVEHSQADLHGTECILCGLCVRFCEEVVGVGVIGLANRGIDREVAPPFEVASDICIGCGACTYICPTDCIEMVPDEKTPRLHSMKMGNRSLVPCPNNYQCESCPTVSYAFDPCDF